MRTLLSPVRVTFLRNAKKAAHFRELLFYKTGNDLFSQAVSRQVSSALKSLTSVFGMGTGGSSSPSSPDLFFPLFKQNNEKSFPLSHSPIFSWLSFRSISIGQLHTLLHFHLRPIYLVVSQESLTFRPGYLFSWGASHLDAFSAYPFHT